MQKTPTGVALHATNLVDFAECGHRTANQMQEVAGRYRAPGRPSARSAHLSSEGLAHEARYLAALKEQYGEDRVLVIAGDRDDLERHEEGVELTRRALAGDDYDVIYQARFRTGPYVANADFVVRIDGEWQVIDAKLARQPRPSALLQITHYSAHLAAVTGRQPARMHIASGDNQLHSFEVGKYAAYERRVREDHTTFVQNPRTTRPEPIEPCAHCAFLTICETDWTLRDPLSNLPGATPQFRSRLSAAGIHTVAALKDAPRDQPVPGVSPATWARQHGHAELQIASRESGGRPQHRFLVPPRPGVGLAALPQLHRRDIIFDLEGSGPRADGDPIQYMWGHRYLGSRVPHRFWAFDEEAESAALVRFLQLVIDNVERYPGTHVIHYSSYEQDALSQLTTKYGVMAPELADLRRAGTFLDAYPVTRASILTSEDGYSLKAVARHAGFEYSGQILEAGASMVAFEQAISDAFFGGRFHPYVARRMLHPVVAYNNQDLDALGRVVQFLELGRSELIMRGHEIERPAPRVRTRTFETEEEAVAAEAAAAAAAEVDARLRTVHHELLDGVPRVPSERDNEQEARWALAEMQEWHRREASPEWSAYYERLEKTEAELFDDSAAIAGLVPTGDPPEKDPTPRSRSLLHSYTFDPSQPFSIGIGEELIDPATRGTAGTVVAIEMRGEDAVVVLKRAASSDAPHPTSAVMKGGRDTTAQRQAILELGELVLEIGMDAPGPSRAIRDLLVRRYPVIEGIQQSGIDEATGETITAVPLMASIARPENNLRGLVADMAETSLMVQGPPGTGKTRAAAKVIVDASQRGERVAITGSAHKIITNLVDAVCAEARSRGVEPSIFQKGDRGTVSTDSFVTRAQKNDDVVKALAEGSVDIVAGTPWLFSIPELRPREVPVPEGHDVPAGHRARTLSDGSRVAVRHEAFELLVIDEAGRFALADAVAIGSSARNIVAFGDPQQLDQPTRGRHAKGIDVSLLRYYIDTPTVSPDRGVLLPSTYRLHPDLVKVVGPTYDDRLRAHRSTRGQRVELDHPLGGTGSRIISVRHQNRSYSAPEEAEAIARLYDVLTKGTWVDSQGNRRPVAVSDILTQTLTNAQVATIGAALKAKGVDLGEARVATVDKSQGQEAPVQIYSMVGSGDGNLAHSFGFQFDPARLNTAISRAQALSIIVMSPRLPLSRPATPEQMEMLNRMHDVAEQSRVFNAEFQPTTLAVEGQRPSAREQPLIGTPQPLLLLARDTLF